MFDKITEEEYTKYFSINESPKMFERYKMIAINMMSKYNLKDMSDTCKSILESAVFEQIFYLINKDIDSDKDVSGVKLGDASESYTIKKGYDDLVSPIALELLKNAQCNFFYTGNVSLKICCDCKCGKK